MMMTIITLMGHKYLWGSAWRDQQEGRGKGKDTER
jgi:hypothetical protein